MSDLLDLRLGAEAGDPNAQTNLALELLHGPLTRGAQDEALKWVIAASGQGHAEALLLHAVLAVRGLCRPWNVKEGYALLAQAAAAGSARAQGQLAVLSEAGAFESEVWGAEPDLEQHFDAPRIYTIADFIPQKACKWLISQVRRRLRRAPVYAASGDLVVGSSRTNSAASFRSLDLDVVLQLVKLRIALVTNVPMLNQDPTHILNYERGQEFLPHYDFTTGAKPDPAGQRIGTLLIYLNDDYDGGETGFPSLNWRYKGNTGDALLFWNVSAKGQIERDSLHAGLPVTKGVKWVLSQWMRETTFALGRST